MPKWSVTPYIFCQNMLFCQKYFPGTIFSLFLVYTAFFSPEKHPKAANLLFYNFRSVSVVYLIN
jgi:hypothetical protein